MTQINRSRKDTRLRLVFWSAKNTGEATQQSGAANWFGQLSEGCIARWPSLLIPSISFSLCLPTGYVFSPLVLPFPLPLWCTLYHQASAVGLDSAPAGREWDYFLLHLLFLFPHCCQLLQQLVFFLKASGAGIMWLHRNFFFHWE